MKDLTLSVAAVLLAAMGIGLLFHWVYPRVEPSAELAALFVFVALLLRLLLSKGWALLRRVSQRTGTQPRR